MEQFSNVNTTTADNMDEEQLQSRRLDYTVKMTREERETLGHDLKQEIRRFEDETRTRRSNAEAWRRDAELFP